MKIICTQENLRGGLATVARIISPTNTLPVLNNLLLKTENGLLKISSTNLEVGISTEIRCKIEEEGAVTVFSKTFTELITNLPSTNITLTSHGGTLTVDTDLNHSSLKTLPAEEFPLIPEIEGQQKFTVNSQLFKVAVEEVAFAASTNQTQPEISGVLLTGEGKELKLVATDRYRLAEKKLTLPSSLTNPIQVIIPHKTIAEIARIISHQEEQLEVTIGETQIGFIINQTKVVSRLIDGQYPPYQAIIPSQFRTEAVAQRQPLLSALRAGSIFSQSNNSVKLAFNPSNNELQVTAESDELGTSLVQIPAEVSGESGELLLNHRYLQECLSTIDSETITLKVNDSSSPAIITPQKESSYLYLVMPIKS